MTENYRGCYEYLSAQYPEVGGYEFYKWSYVKFEYKLN